MKGFVGDLYSRPSCGACSFKGVNRCSDLTLGDCWGIWDSHPEFDDNKGTSWLLIQSSKGQQWWNEIQGSFHCIELKTEDAVRSNPSTVKASAAHEKRSIFFSRFGQEPVEQLIMELLTPKQPPRPSLLKRVLRRLGIN